MKPAPDRAGYTANATRKRRRLTPDGRTHGARRLKALIASFSEGLGDLSTIDKALIRTAAALTYKMETIENDLAAGKPVASDDLIRLASTSRRALAAVSAKAVDRKPTTQTLAEYWASKNEQAEAGDDD
jgi:hypothetical protein